MSTYTVKSGDVLLVPTSTDALAPITVEWQQNWSDKSASYHTGLVGVKGKPDAKVLFFVASEWFTNPSAGSPAQHISKATTKAGQFYELKADDKVRYGQKNVQGEARFIVYHDTSRNPYQHRFVKPVMKLQALGLAKFAAGMFGVPSMVGDFTEDSIKALVGDELRKF